ncbi:hypothetical protein [Xanthomonas campestris]|uniref:hypothetical protein n=1 Tax=Xanthomonas cannabis TaxID=1885674 RepID=UPI001E57DE16|nr:hypothetical protein [Xanthomonas campestris pv. zinniae]
MSIGTAYQEALKALAEQVARAYREDCCSFQVSAGLIQGNTMIAVSATFDATGTECWVPMSLGSDQWTDERRSRIEHDARAVISQRLSIEEGVAYIVRKYMREVLDGYR